MIKKILFVIAIFSSMLFSASVSFVNAPKNPKHKLPNGENELFSFSSILQDPMSAVVNISTRTINYQGNLNREFFKNFFGSQQMPPQKSENSLGSGVIISKDGYIVTNNHVIEGADEISVTIHGIDREFIARIVGRDKGSDLAVVKIEAKDLKPITFGYIDDVKIGDIVFAIGNPFGVGQSVTQGIISAMNKYGVGINQYENFIQTDASINPGNSGGALIDSRGVLIGINSAILSQSGGNHGIGFTIPINMVRNIVSKLILDGKVERGFMGVNISKVTKELKGLYKHQKGAIITDVQFNSPAQKAKLKRGDLVYAINGKEIKSPHDLQQIVTSFCPHDTITISIERDGKEIEKKLKLSNIGGEKLALSSIDKNFEGLYINMVNKTNREKFGIPPAITGVVVEKIDINSQAYIDGFSAGDLIIQIENISIDSVEDATRAFKKYKGRTKRIYINRRGDIMLIVTK